MARQCAACGGRGSFGRWPLRRTCAACRGEGFVKAAAPLRAVRDEALAVALADVLTERGYPEASALLRSTFSPVANPDTDNPGDPTGGPALGAGAGPQASRAEVWAALATLGTLATGIPVPVVAEAARIVRDARGRADAARSAAPSRNETDTPASSFKADNTIDMPTDETDTDNGKGSR